MATPKVQEKDRRMVQRKELPKVQEKVNPTEGQELADPKEMRMAQEKGRQMARGKDLPKAREMAERKGLHSGKNSHLRCS